MQLTSQRQALRVALVYIIVTGGAILSINQLVSWMFSDPASRVQGVLFGCLAFALASGLFVYLAVLRCLERSGRAAAEREQAHAAEAEIWEKLRRREEQLRLGLEATADGLWDWNIVTGEEYFSPRWKEIVGYRDEELANRKSTFLDLLHPDDRALVDRAAAEQLEKGVRYVVQFRLRHKDGTYRWVSSRGEAVRDAQGKTVRMVGAITDITEQKQVENARRESEEKFAKIFQCSPMPFSLSTVADGRYLDVNDEFLRVIQRSREEVIGRTALELGVWADAAQRAGVIAILKERGTVRGYELDVRNLAGQTRHLLWSAEVVVIGGESCLLGVSLDITERKLADEQRRESEERYRQLFELESDAVILVDCETHRFVDVNQSAQELYGYSREEFLAKTAEEIADEADKARAQVGAGNKFIPVCWHRKKNGERFAVEITCNVISYQGRRTELATLRDITTRQRVMEMLGETTDQLLEAQQIAGLGSYVFDLETGCWTGSEVLHEILGLPDDGAKREVSAWLQLIHPEDRAASERYLHDEVLKNRLPFDRIYRIIRPNDGQVRWVHGLGKLILNDSGKVTRLVGVIQNITERKRAEERMNVQISALAAAANAIAITGRSGRIEWVNPAFTKISGYSADEAVGKSFRLLKSGQHPRAFYANLWDTVVAGNVWHGEITNRRKDGHLYNEEMTVTPVRNTTGQITHFVAIKQDVTERRQLERQVMQAQKMEAIGTLAGGIAHDFNNILAAMFGYVHLLEQDIAGNAEAEESIREILKAAGRAKDLVQQILTFSRQREHKRQIIQLDTVVKEAVKFLRASLPAQIKIELNLRPDTPAVLADPTQIYQVAINLATNALHAMEGQPGQLTVSLVSFLPEPGFIRLHPEFQPAPYASLIVTDTGRGMDSKTMERVFEPFFTTKPIGKGTGLGLAVVHGIVQSHNGVITVESQVGVGTTFRIYFPGQIQSADSAVVSTPPSRMGNGERILLLDDEPALTGALRRLLERLNYRVTVSNQAREVVDWYQNGQAPFDLVITDLTMPELTGIDVARQLHLLRPELPIILASGFSADVSRETLDDAGICELLEKPISRDLLAEVVQRSLAGKGIHLNGVDIGVPAI